MDDKLHNPFDVLNERLKRIEDLLSRMLLESQTHLTDQKHKAQDKSIELAIAITGLKKKTIYNLAYKRQIAHSKRGKRLYFDEAELNQWITTGRRKTLEERGLTK